MKGLIQPKLLVFYGSTLVLVLLLFRWITAYGEANLQAPPNINGRYVSPAVPSKCPADNALVLTIEQSGIYLNGDVALEQGQQTARSAAHAPTLKGRWQNGQVILSGRTSALTVCSPDWNSIVVEGKIADAPAASSAPPTFTGQLTLPDAQVWPLNAEQQPDVGRTDQH